MIVRPLLHAPPQSLPATGRTGLAVLLALLLATSYRPAHAEFMAGGDISALTTLEEHGAVYTLNGVPGDAIDIMSGLGMNWVRLRLMVDPNGENILTQDLPYTIALAQRAKAAGAKVLLDFYYSDTWANHAAQQKPAAWDGLSFTELEQQVYDYSKGVIEAFKAANVTPEMVQIGNSISKGILWEKGRLGREEIPDYVEFDNLATLLSAGIQGTRDGADVGNEPLIMINHPLGVHWNATSYWFGQMLPRLQANGTDIDVIGYGYFPRGHYNPNTGKGGIDDLEQNLNNTATVFGKPVVVVEARFPNRGAELEPEFEFEVSPEGQQEFLQAVVDTVQAVPNEMGWGVLWWYPESVPTEGLVEGKEWRYGLFDENGELLPAMNVFDDVFRIPGDYDGDGAVTAADYVYMRDALGQETLFNPDGDRSGIVDDGDRLLWQANYGQTAEAAGASVTATIPEPSGLALAALALLLGLLSQRVRPIQG